MPAWRAIMGDFRARNGPRQWISLTAGLPLGPKGDFGLLNGM
jgi:hypothetical protein